VLSQQIETIITNEPTNMTDRDEWLYRFLDPPMTTGSWPQALIDTEAVDGGFA